MISNAKINFRNEEDHHNVEIDLLETLSINQKVVEELKLKFSKIYKNDQKIRVFIDGACKGGENIRKVVNFFFN